jgi:hypothetical protein
MFMRLGSLIGIVLIFSILDEDRDPVQYDFWGQERCEEICFSCIDRGGEPDTCASGFMFRFCCYKNGGKTSGCGCREGL